MIPTIFIQKAADILGATNGGLTAQQIITLCASYACDFGVEIPYSSYPYPMGSFPVKKIALKENLLKFSSEQQFKIIKELCELDCFKGDENVKKLKLQLLTKYGSLNNETGSLEENLINGTIHWLNEYPDSLKLYKDALTKFNSKAFERNLLDDIRLSLELLLKNIFHNDKSLDNQISNIGTFVNGKGCSTEFSNMFLKLIDYFSKYQNNHIKHNNKVIEEEIEFVFEITSVFMKNLVRLNNI